MVGATYNRLMSDAAQDRSRPRGRTTRARLVAAAIDSLTEGGYAATTTIEVASRARVSRGAQLHHFPTRASLLAAAVDQLLVVRIEEFRRAFAHAEPGSGRVDSAIDLLWSLYQGPTFAAWVELWIASRSDLELRAVVVETDRRFIAESRAIAAEIFASDETGAVAFGFALALMNGLALQRLIPTDHLLSPEQSIDILKLLAKLTLDQPEAADTP